MFVQMLAQIHPITLDKDYVNSKASSSYPAKAHAPTPYLEEIIGGCDPFYKKKKDDPFNPSPSPSPSPPTSSEDQALGSSWIHTFHKHAWLVKWYKGVK